MVKHATSRREEACNDEGQREQGGGGEDQLEALDHLGRDRAGHPRQGQRVNSNE